MFPRDDIEMTVDRIWIGFGLVQIQIMNFELISKSSPTKFIESKNIESKSKLIGFGESWIQAQIRNFNFKN